jgi:hypothetical protein
MKSASITGGACILLLLASAASCAVSKEYANRVFNSKPQKKIDSTLAVKFMEFDSGSASDSIELAKVFTQETVEPVITDAKDSSRTEIATMTIPEKSIPEKPVPVITETKKAPKDMSSGTVRSKRKRQ